VETCLRNSIYFEFSAKFICSMTKNLADFSLAELLIPIGPEIQIR
jgi:hypothetical protein